MSDIYPKLTLTHLENLLKSRFKEGFLSLRDLPHPSLFKDMEKATQRIVKAMQENEKIIIIGDYDVDGVTSTTLMKRFFEEIDYPVEWIIPNRFTDGYGLSAHIIPRIKDFDLAVTVDNGISAVYAAKLCKEVGIELIITDHHLLSQEMPECFAIINPKQETCTFPYDDVCGAQIAWYLIASLKNALQIHLNLLPYMELVAIAIIADMMPLLHINRMMVEAGLQALNKSDKPAIKAFMEHSQKETLSAEDIGFFLAPLLNSAGRMDDATYSVAFLLSSNIYDARVRLEKLLAFNALRKATEQEITAKALAKVNPEHKVIVVEGEEWHEGVVGIVAARVARVHEKPCIVLSNDGKGGLKGSGRSYGGCNLFRVTHSCKEYLEKFGGHHAAIGLSLAQMHLEAFETQLQEAYKKEEHSQENGDSQIIGELQFSLLSFELIALLKRFEPYGQGNQVPKFISKNVQLLDVQTMGKEGEHLRFSFEQDGIAMQGVQFKTDQKYEHGSTVSVVYSVNENHFRGNVTLQLMVDKILG